MTLDVKYTQFHDKKKWHPIDFSIVCARILLSVSVKKRKVFL